MTFQILVPRICFRYKKDDIAYVFQNFFGNPSYITKINMMLRTDYQNGEKFWKVIVTCSHNLSSFLSIIQGLFEGGRPPNMKLAHQAWNTMDPTWPTLTYESCKEIHEFIQLIYSFDQARITFQEGNKTWFWKCYLYTPKPKPTQHTPRIKLPLKNRMDTPQGLQERVGEEILYQQTSNGQWKVVVKDVFGQEQVHLVA